MPGRWRASEARPRPGRSCRDPRRRARHSGSRLECQATRTQAGARAAVATVSPPTEAFFCSRPTSVPSLRGTGTSVYARFLRGQATVRIAGELYESMIAVMRNMHVARASRAPVPDAARDGELRKDPWRRDE